ncbi:M10 family metallopeptidase C-terminal domain-containing protein, partial [Pseudodonghicola flavimaris]
GGGGEIYDAYINIAKNWSGTGNIGDYYFHTALHEIGHTLGLGHQGLYNAGSGTPTYNDSNWENDTIQFTMMSYWAQANYTPPGQSTPSGSYLGQVNVIGPQSVDWLALDRIYNPMGYGIDDGTTTGNTTWGFNSTWVDWTPTSTGPGFGYANTAYASLDTLLATNTLAIVDGGGIDTLDLSGYSNNSKIDLRVTSSANIAPSFSDVAGLIGNLSIAPGTVIENAVGGAGNEVIYGNNSANTLDGGGGNDSIYGYDGNDTLIGGTGNDYLSGGNDNDTLHGGAGIDTMYGSAGDDTFLYENGEDSVAGEYASGGTGSDRILASGSGVFDLRTLNVYLVEEIEFAATGTNVVNFVYLGSDELGGSDFSSSLLIDGNGSTGSDNTLRLWVQNGVNNIDASGFIFQDWNSVSTDIVSLHGDANANILTGTSQDDIIYGFDGNDTLRGGTGVNQLYGGNDNDTFVYLDGFDPLAGEIISGGAGHDRLLVGNAGVFDLRNASVSLIEELEFRADGANVDNFVYIGSDQIGSGFSSTMLIDGNANTSSNNTLRMYVQNGVSSIDASGFTFQDWDSYTGDADYISLHGDANANTLIGTSKDDIIYGNDGNDTLRGGAGADAMYGGNGNDTFLYVDGEDSVTGEVLAGSTGSDRILLQGAGYFDLRTASITAVEEVEFSAVGGGGIVNYAFFGSDQLGTGLSSTLLVDGNSNAGSFNSLHFFVQNGVANIDLSGFTFQDWNAVASDSDTVILHGDTGSNTLTGSSQIDVIYGNDGGDVLLGGAGDDSLYGGDGNDNLTGGAGADVQSGGAGNDNFFFYDGEDEGPGSIIDGGTEYDRVVMSGAGVFNLSTVAFTSIEELEFYADGINVDNELQLGSAAVASAFGTVLIDGNANSGSDNIIRIIMTGGVTDVDLSGWTFQDWQTPGLDNDQLIVLGDGADNKLIGSSRIDSLFGGTGNDLLDGGLGDDILTGEGGDDDYVVDSLGDSVVEAVGEGIDTIWTALASFSLGTIANVENLTGTS